MMTPGNYKLSGLTVALLLSLATDLHDRKVAVTAGETDDDFTVTATTRSKRAEARVERDARSAEIKDVALASLEIARPLKIGPLVDDVAKHFGITDADKVHDLRAPVLEALRELRDSGTLLAQNPTGSNFHVRWTLAAKPDEFPIPQPKPELAAKVATVGAKKRGRPAKVKTVDAQPIETLEVKGEREAA